MECRIEEKTTEERNKGKDKKTKKREGEHRRGD